jgi:5S rRNA maturation endonuclease (ribonuclease M5)
MKQNKKTFRLYSQYQLKKLSDTLCDDIENLLMSLNITEYKMLDKMIVMRCPIHDGDNNSAFNLYYTGDNYRGNWKCRTHGCESVFKSSILGFIRGCLSKDKGWSTNGDPTVSFAEALDYAIKFTKTDINKYKESKHQQEKHTFIKNVHNLVSTTISPPKTKFISRNTVRKNLSIPSQYFIDRGFSPEILDKYDVGDCLDQNKEMSNRAVVPIYDHDYLGMSGCTGRSIHNKCETCKSYHIGSCPNENHRWLFSKWKHNKDFKTQEHLYNLWFAKEFINKTRTVIVVESPGNVWRLEEAGVHNSVAIFGTNLSAKQKMLLDISGAMNLITIMDNDTPGQEAAKIILGKCSKTYNTKNIIVPKNDIAEMTVQEIQEYIIPQIQEYTL